MRGVGSDELYTLFYGGAEELKNEWSPIKEGMFGGDYLKYHEL